MRGQSGSNISSIIPAVLTNRLTADMGKAVDSPLYSNANKTKNHQLRNVQGAVKLTLLSVTGLDLDATAQREVCTHMQSLKKPLSKPAIQLLCMSLNK